MLICQSRIVKTYKTRKADCLWPYFYLEPSVNTVLDSINNKKPPPQRVLTINNDAENLPICGGTVTCTLKVVNSPYMGGTDAELRFIAECTKCKHPYFEGALKLGYVPEDTVVSDMLYKYLCLIQKCNRK